MNRFITMTSIAAITLGTATFAQDADVATDAEINQIMKYAPDATVAQIAALSDQRIDSLIGIINAGGNENDIRRQVQAEFVAPGNSAQATGYIGSPNGPTDSEISAIMGYAPDATAAQITALSNERIDALVGLINSGDSENDIRRQVQAVFTAPGTGDQTTVYVVPADAPTESEISTIMKYAPQVTVAQITALSDERIDSLIAYVNSGESESNKRRYVQGTFE